MGRALGLLHDDPRLALGGRRGRCRLARDSLLAPRDGQRGLVAEHARYDRAGLLVEADKRRAPL